MNIFPIPEGYTSFQFIRESASTKVQSITRYNQKKGGWESSSLLFGQPTGVDFSILPKEAYLIMLKGDKN